LLFVSGVLAIGLALSEHANAQFNTGPTRSSGTTSAGMFGNRTVGGASGLTGGARSFTGGRNQQTLGQNQQLGGGQSVLGRTLQNATSGGIGGQSRFLRQNRTGQFVGSDQGDIGASLGTLGGNQQGLAGLTSLMQQQLRPNQQGRQRNNQPNQTSTFGGRGQQPVYRISRGAAFEVPASAGGASAVSERLSQLVNRSRSIQAETPLVVEVRGRIAILQGSVASDRARDLAAQLVLLEPGVDQVDNQLEVAGADSAAEPE
jgi:hypothetical protein